jgi:hypothetical protein
MIEQNQKMAESTCGRGRTESISSVGHVSARSGCTVLVGSIGGTRLARSPGPGDGPIG